MDKLLILDGNSVLHRAYYALPDWRNRSGEATAGVYGFMSMLLKSIEDLRPTHLAVVFDHPSPTFRHHLYVGYQTNREKDRQVSEDIWGQVDKLMEVLKKMGVAVYQIEGFEADDIIGTLCRKFEIRHPKARATANSNFEIIIVTGDRDLMQLVSTKVSLYMPQKGLTDAVVVGRKQVKARLGVWPEQVTDYKALVGDSSDNYPGVVGVGPKTAVRLLEEFGSFDNIYSGLGRSLGLSTTQRDLLLKLRFKLESGYEGGKLSKKLAAIKTDVPVTFEKTVAELPPGDRLVQVFVDLGYKSLVRRLSADTATEIDKQPSLFK